MAPRPQASPRSARRLIAAAAASVLVSAAHIPAALAKVFLSQEEALSLAFAAQGRPERCTAYLTDEQAERVRSSAGTAPQSRVVVYYVGGSDPNRPTTAYFDTHLVRTLPESIMVVVSPDGRVARVDILSFEEPEDYLPHRRWLDQFPERRLDDDLSTKRGIRAVTGATLSSRAITDAVRRVLATHAVIAAPAAETRP